MEEQKPKKLTKKRIASALIITLLLVSLVIILYKPPLPVKAATFGNENADGSWINLFADNKFGCLFTLAEEGNLTSITAWLRDYAETGQSNAVRYGVYNSSLDLEGYTEEGNTPAAATQVQLNFTVPLALSAGNYYLSAIFGARTEFLADTGDANQYLTNGDTYADNFADPFGSPSNSSYEIMIYATYTPTGGGDITAPTYSGVGHNNTVAGDPTKFSMTANDETALNGNGLYILSTNNTGTWSNSTSYNFSSTPESVSVTISLNATEDLLIGYLFYLSDNAGNWNTTSTYTLTTTNESATVLFEAYHETGDLSEYTSTENVTVSTDTAHHGSYSLKATNQTGIDVAYGAATINPESTHYFIRWFLNFSRWPVSNQEHYWFALGNGSQGITVGNVGRDDGSEVYIYSGGFFEEKWYSANTTVLANAYDEWQLEIQEGNGDGYAILKHNGVERISVTDDDILATDTDLSFHWGINNIPSETGENCIWYYDCVTVSTQELPTDDGGEEESDTTKPTYSNLSTSTTLAGQSCNFNATFNDDTALQSNGQYDFGTNNTGTWVWEGDANFTSTPESLGVTKTLNSTVGITVSYQWNFTDNAGNTNTTGLQNITTTDYVYTLSLTITNPQNTTYTTSSVSVDLSSSGNDTNPAYSWNAKFSNGTWLYVSNQTGTSATMTINENQTDVLFACYVEGDNGANDYGEVYFTVSIPATVYTLTLTVTNPQNTTYAHTIPVELSTSGNETNPVITWNFQYSNSSWHFGSNQTYTVSTSFEIIENATGTFCAYAVGDHSVSDYQEVELTVQYIPVYTLSLTISSPANTTYTSASVTVTLSNSGNDTNKAYSWNAYFANSTTLYESNQTSASATMTVSENATLTFACLLSGDHESDYSEVVFTVYITSSSSSSTEFISLYYSNTWAAISLFVVLPVILSLTMLFAMFYLLKQGSFDMTQVIVLFAGFVVFSVWSSIGIIMIAVLQNTFI